MTISQHCYTYLFGVRLIEVLDANGIRFSFYIYSVNLTSGCRFFCIVTEVLVRLSGTCWVGFIISQLRFCFRTECDSVMALSANRKAVEVNKMCAPPLGNNSRRFQIIFVQINSNSLPGKKQVI